MLSNTHSIITSVVVETMEAAAAREAAKKALARANKETQRQVAAGFRRLAARKAALEATRTRA